MATTGTWSFAPGAADVVVNAYSRLQIRRTELTQPHLADAQYECNMVQVEFSNRQPLWWTTEEITQTLTASDGEYDFSSRIVTVIAAYISTTASSQVTDRIITPISTYDYAAIPNKLTPTGVPTTFKFERLQSGTRVTLWQVPDDEDTYTLKMRVLSQPEDVSLPSGVNIDAPYRFLDAYTAALSHRLARIWKPELEERRAADAERAWLLAANQDVENVPVYISPGVSSYYQ